MKGTIVNCLEDLVKEKVGRDGWKQVLTDAGLSPVTIISTTASLPDEQVISLIAAAAGVLHISVQQAMDAFGEYWSSVYAPKMYGPWFAKATNAREFLLNMDNVHIAITKNVAEAAPPRFTFEDKGPHEMVMNYSSPRGLVALMPGLIRGVGKYFNENLQVRATGNAMYITFP